LLLFFLVLTFITFMARKREVDGVVVPHLMLWPLHATATCDEAARQLHALSLLFSPNANETTKQNVS
jgi:hypothetical protein